MQKLLYTVAFVSLLFSCQSKKDNATKPLQLTVTAPMLVDTTFSVDYIADIQSKQNVEIRSKINGYLEKIYVDEGSHVKAGQVLFKLSNIDFQQEVRKSQALLRSAVAQAKSAKLELQNVQKLYDKNIVSKAELDQVQIQLELAQAKIEEAQAHEQSAQFNLSLTTIKAPFDGVIHRIPFKLGSLINDGTLLTTLSNNTEVYAYFNVSEKEYLSLTQSNNMHLDAEISLLLANNQPHKYPGIIENQDGEFDRGTGNIAFRAKFPNPELLIKHGSTGKVRLNRPLKKAMIIPQKATYEIQDKLYVYVVTQEAKVVSKNIKIKQRLPHLFVLESGLSASDKILFEGLQNIKDGDKIEPRFVPLNQLNINN